MDKDLIIHYFLKDPTLHQLNARLVNTNQANIISIIEMISQKLGIDVDVDVLAVKEGGLKDILNVKITKRDIFVGAGSVVVTFLVNVMSNFLTQDTELNALQKEYYKAQIEQAKLNSQVCEKTNKELDGLKQRIDNLETTETSVKIKRKRSAIYTQMNDNMQITSFAMEEFITKHAPPFSKGRMCIFLPLFIIALVFLALLTYVTFHYSFNKYIRIAEVITFSLLILLLLCTFTFNPGAVFLNDSITKLNM